MFKNLVLRSFTRHTSISVNTHTFKSISTKQPFCRVTQLRYFSTPTQNPGYDEVMGHLRQLKDE